MMCSEEQGKEINELKAKVLSMLEVVDRHIALESNLRNECEDLKSKYVEQCRLINTLIVQMEMSEGHKNAIIGPVCCFLFTCIVVCYYVLCISIKYIWCD